MVADSSSRSEPKCVWSENGCRTKKIFNAGGVGDNGGAEEDNGGWRGKNGGQNGAWKCDPLSEYFHRQMDT